MVSRWLRTCLQLMTFFSSETCLLHFCTKMSIAKPEEACSHHKFNLVSFPPGYAEVLIALMAWIVALQADNFVMAHTVYAVYSALFLLIWKGKYLPLVGIENEV